MYSLPNILAGTIVAALAYLALVAIAATALALRQGGRREESPDGEAASASRFTIPVSLIVPIGAGVSDATAVTTTIASILDLKYPEIEVIVVAEELLQPVRERLKIDWALEAREFFYRRTLATGAVRKIYRSSRDPRLMLVEKAAAGGADALNCGVNLARFRYVGALDVGTEFDRNALLRAMAAPLRNPAAVVAASSQLETGANGGAAFQRLASVRSFMEGRVVWHAMPFALGPQDAFVVWRRDSLVHLGGFSKTAANPALDMMVRLQTAAAPGRGRVVRNAEIFGRIGARSRSATIRAAACRQRAAFETLRACGRAPTLGRGNWALAYFLVSELVTPAAQLWVVTATLFGAAMRWFAPRDAVLAVILLSLGRAVISCAALLLRGAAADAPDTRALRALLLVTPFELVGFGSIGAFARIASLAGYRTSAIVPEPGA